MGVFSKTYEALTTDAGFVNFKEYLFNTYFNNYQGLEQDFVTNYGTIKAHKELSDNDFTILRLYLSDKYGIDIGVAELKTIIEFISNQKDLVVIGEPQDMAGAYERYITL
ncbi:hypothetical protein QLH62_11420 [Streptococcus iniae]|nr:hypothetical protein QLH62_11420 [Streptococcus iniae]